VKEKTSRRKLGFRVLCHVLAMIVDDPDAPGHLHSLDHLEYSANGHVPGAIPKNATVKKPISPCRVRPLSEKSDMAALSAFRKTAPVFLPRLWAGQDAGPPARRLAAGSGEGNAGPCAAAGRGHGHLWKVTSPKILS